MNIIVWAALIQGLLLAIIFLTSKKHNSFSNKLLGLFLIALIFEAILEFIPFDYIWNYSIKKYFELPEPKIFLPLLFLHYVLVKLGYISRYRLFFRVNYFIAVSVVFITVVNIFLFVFNQGSIHNFLTPVKSEIIFLSQQTYAFLLSAVALGIALKETNNYKRNVENNYSDLDLLNISWLWRFILLLFPATLLWGAELIRIFWSFYTNEFTQWDFVDIIWAMVILFIYYVSYQAFQHKDLFEVKVSEIEEKDSIVSDVENNWGELEVPLLDCMQEKKLYLQSDITLFDVARQIGTSTRKVSNCINNHFNSNFSEWVNGFRIDEVKRRFEDNSLEYLTIEAIGKESGFKSRSAMYTAFKRYTGYSPAEFRKSSLS